MNPINWIRLRIWGSGVRISSGAPTLSHCLPCKNYWPFTGFARKPHRRQTLPTTVKFSLRMPHPQALLVGAGRPMLSIIGANSCERLGCAEWKQSRWLLRSHQPASPRPAVVGQGDNRVPVLAISKVCQIFRAAHCSSSGREYRFGRSTAQRRLERSMAFARNATG
jgi:hypothetical protein